MMGEGVEGGWWDVTPLPHSHTPFFTLLEIFVYLRIMREKCGFHISSTYESLIKHQTPLPPSRRHAREGEGTVNELIKYLNNFRRRMNNLG